MAVYGVAWGPAPPALGLCPAPAYPVCQQHCPESRFFGCLSPKLTMPGRRSSPPHWGHHLRRFPSAPACRLWGPQSYEAWEPPRPLPLLCRDMALQNALYTGDLARLRELFPPGSTADLLLECKAAEPRWTSHQRGKEGACAEGLRTQSLG